MQDILLFTTPFVDGYIIEEYKGMIMANQVAGTGFLSDFTASASDFFGGKSGTYRNQMEDLYTDVRLQLTQKARQLGANAIIGVSSNYDNIGAKGMSMFMLSMQGTAVKISKDRFSIYKKLHELNTYKQEGLLSEEEYERESESVKKSMVNLVQQDTKKELAKKQEEEKQAAIAEKMKEQAELKKEAIKAKLQDIDKLTSSIQCVNGLSVGDIVIVNETGDATPVIGFTEDELILCELDEELRILTFNDVEII